MNLERLTRSIKQAEGYRKHPYLDTLGNLTTGFGHLIEHDRIQHLGMLTVGEIYKHYSDPNHHARWLDEDIAEAIKRAREWVGSDLWELLGSVRQEVISEMRFQLGYKQTQFHGVKQALELHDYTLAHDRMLDSLWAKQTPQRVERLAQRMATGFVNE